MKQDMKAHQEQLDRCCEELRSRGMHRRHRNLLRQLDYVFRYTELSGKSMLDLGGGTGYLSLLAAACGARPVENLEPGAHLKASFEATCGAMGYEGVTFREGTLQGLDLAPSTYDVILSFNSINHLDEEACTRLDRDEGARSLYLDLFNKLHEAARPGCHLIIADCSNRNLFPALGLANPLMRPIEWHKHQPPEVWIDLLGRTGLSLHRNLRTQTSLQNHSRPAKP